MLWTNVTITHFDVPFHTNSMYLLLTTIFQAQRNNMRTFLGFLLAKSKTIYEASDAHKSTATHRAADRHYSGGNITCRKVATRFELSALPPASFGAA